MMKIPKEVKKVVSDLQTAGFEAYVVGGCVRDVLLGKEPNDWDIATQAVPEEIQRVFSNSFYENNFLTVTVKTGSELLPEIEVTTYRLEAGYSDKRHPDEVRYAKTLEEDLSRRDFTVNALAICEKVENRKQKLEVIDLYDGQGDLKKKIIKTVGNPDERFSEDALRMLRAVRFATTLGFTVEEETAKAIVKNSVWLEAISQERVRDELVKIIMAEKAADGIEMLRALGLLKIIMPELQENYGVGQNKHHIYDCYTHAVKALEYAAKKGYNMHVRLAALLHDIAKPRVKAGQGPESTFYNHQIVGAKMAFEILSRLKLSKKDIEKVVNLIRYHMFYYNAGEVTEASVRRLVKNVGPENMDDLLKLREADRIGSGVPKAEPYKLRHLKYLIEKVAKDPISAKMIKINGKDIMSVLGIEPGPKVGHILNILLGHVLDDPKKNTKEFLHTEAERLGALSEKELVSLAEKAEEQKLQVEMKEDSMTKQKYWVS